MKTIQFKKEIFIPLFLNILLLLSFACSIIKEDPPKQFLNMPAAVVYQNGVSFISEVTLAEIIRSLKSGNWEKVDENQWIYRINNEIRLLKKNEKISFLFVKEKIDGRETIILKAIAKQGTELSGSEKDNIFNSLVSNALEERKSSTKNESSAVETIDKNQNYQKINPEVIFSRYGDIKVTKENPEEAFSAKILKFNGVIIEGIEDDSITLEALFQVGNKDIILLSADCMGSGCGGDTTEYYFVTIKPNKTYSVSKKFYVDNFQTEINGDTIILKEKEGKVVIYQNDKVSVHNRPKIGPAPDDYCKGLFDLYHSCSDLKQELNNPKDCEKDFWRFGHIRIKDHSYFSKDGRINTPSFDQLCRESCKSDKYIDYNLFKRKVCYGKD